MQTCERAVAGESKENQSGTHHSQQQKRQPKGLHRLNKTKLFSHEIKTQKSFR